MLLVVKSETHALNMVVELVPDPVRDALRERLAGKCLCEGQEAPHRAQAQYREYSYEDGPLGDLTRLRDFGDVVDGATDELGEKQVGRGCPAAAK
ncbi:MAG TPA: hypothetical protein EYM39_11055 [Candidatus Latescibacteria bacterium]|nr:hypothetical protein [Candidatus Latescibacterota bacterium]